MPFSQKILEVLQSYDLKNLSIGVLGGHSALDVCHGAKKYGFRTVAVCQKGRDATYSKYYKTRPMSLRAKQSNLVEAKNQQDCHGLSGLDMISNTKGCIDEVILVHTFADIVQPEVQKRLRELNTIFIHNRYFWVYCDFNQIENDFMIPIFGNRVAVKLEERDQPLNQYHLLQKADMRMPKIFQKAEEIDRLVLVKVNEAERGYERAFFKANSFDEYRAKAQEMIKQKIITRASLEKAVIEEFVIGAQVNLNYFYSPLTDELELMGTDMRRQTNLDGLLRLPAWEQMELGGGREGSVSSGFEPKIIETGHVAVTMKESLLEKAYDLGEKFVKVMAKAVPPGMIGPFALQGVVTAEKGREEFVIFDVSMRIPGSPGTRFTPYSGYLYGENISYGERIAMEIRAGMKAETIEKLVT